MPDDRNSEFDIHLQSSISALQSINDDIEFDVALLYCQADVPSKNKSDVINPRDIKKDLVAWKYNVWVVLYTPSIDILKLHFAYYNN